MDQDVFRKALEDAIKGKSANQAPFSKAWATGKLQKKHFARWAENHYHYVGPQISWNKAFTAATHKRSTHLFNKPPNGPALPGNEAFGIQLSFEGKFAVFVGGFPICVDGNIVGGIGMSGGNGQEDTKVGLAALQALADHYKDTSYKIEVAADIKK